ncbi:MAG: HD-GYP domain-containing protein [Butyrivibrio sp.]|nr:HD-GYP domain-containing protein [Butyrivibrio sp.]
MKLAEDVYGLDRSQMILPKGLELTDRTITRLAFYSIVDVLVEGEEPALSPHPEQPYLERLRQSPEFQEFKAHFEDAAGHFKDTINEVVRHERSLNAEEIMGPVYDLIESGDNPSSIFDMLHNLRSYDDATYTHSVNVALIANVLGKWLGMSTDELVILTQAGLFHDIGKLMVPEEIITKPGKLTDEEFTIVKQHTKRGYEILRKSDVSIHVKNAALMHHERCDGFGYPLHLRGPQIDFYAKCISISDVYDALTSARCYRGPLCPFVAIQLIENEGLQRYDPRAIMTFLSNIINTHLMNNVRLSDGREGTVVYINRNSLSRPTVQIGDEFLDLSKNPDITIEAIL